MQFILKIIWLLLPAGVANIVPVLVRKINFLNYPIDANKKLFGQRIFGENKTWRGFFFGILAAMAVIAWQRYAYIYSIIAKSISLFDYAAVNIYLVGFLFGFGALFGDLIKSFIKRRCGIAAGASFVPFDQIDWVIGALLFSNYFFDTTIIFCLAALVIGGLLHPLVNIIGYWLKLKPNRF